MRLNLFATAILLFIAKLSFAQGNYTMGPGEKKRLAEEKRLEFEKQEEKERQKAIKEGKKFHNDIQTKETRKRMKKSRKQAEYNSSRKKPFLKRIFGAKRR